VNMAFDHFSDPYYMQRINTIVDVIRRCEAADDNVKKLQQARDLLRQEVRNLEIQLDENVVVEQTFEVQEKQRGIFQRIITFFRSDKIAVGTKYNIPFTREMMDKVASGAIDENIVTFYCRYLAEKSEEICRESKKMNYRCFIFQPSFYRDFEQRDTMNLKKKIQESNFLDYDKVLVPICESSTRRWALAVINFGKKRLEYYDPFESPKRSSHPHEGSKILKRIQTDVILMSYSQKIGSRHPIPTKFQKIFEEMKLYVVPKIARNSPDLSGLLVCEFMRANVTNMPFNQTSIPDIRRLMQREILEALEKGR